MEQQRALNALEPYLALSKSATSPRAAADLIVQATSAPQTYVFAELLQTPNIQALRKSPEYVAHLKLLEIFAWGTYTDYSATPNLPPLNPQQHQKLMLLSLLPLCSSPTTLTYAHLQSTLFPQTEATTTTSDLEIESLVTTAIYANLLTAHLDPLHRTVRITSVAPLRDLAPNSLVTLSAVLQDWDTRCGGALDDIETQIASIRKRARQERIKNARRDAAFEEALAQADAKEEQHAEAVARSYGEMGGGGRGRGGGGARGMRMGGGGGGGFMGQGGFSRMLGLGGGAKAGKRDAGDVMDLDGDSGGRGSSKGVKRQGRTFGFGRP